MVVAQWPLYYGILVTMLKVGNTAPDLTLTDQRGDPFTLAELWRLGGLVLYFYPRDETPGCTEEACGFRDRHAEFQGAKVAVVGVSPDSDESHRTFSNRHRLPFRLVSDRGGKIAQAFALKKQLGLIPPRVTFVIDANGTVQHVVKGLFRARRHVSETLRALSGIR